MLCYLLIEIVCEFLEMQFSYKVKEEDTLASLIVVLLWYESQMLIRVMDEMGLNPNVIKSSSEYILIILNCYQVQVLPSTHAWGSYNASSIYSGIKIAVSTNSFGARFVCAVRYGAC